MRYINVYRSTTGEVWQGPERFSREAVERMYENYKDFGGTSTLIYRIKVILKRG